MVRFPRFHAALLSIALTGSFATLACKPRAQDSAVLANESGSSVSVDQEFLDTAAKDADSSARKAGYYRAMRDAEIEENRRDIQRTIGTLSIVATDLVIWFDEVKDKSKAGKIPELSKSVDGGEFDRVHQALAIGQQQLKPLLDAAFWEDLTKKGSGNFKTRYDELRASVGFFEGSMRSCADAIRKWNVSSSGWVSKSYSRVKEYKRRMVQQESEGKFPSEAEVKAAYEKDLAMQVAHGPQLLQEVMSNRMGMSRAHRGMNLMQLLAKVPEIAGLFGEPSGVSECYTVWEHTSRVISIWFDQMEAYGYPKDAKLPPHLMAVTVALHDIGKPVDVHRKAERALVPYKCGVQYGDKYDSTGQHVHNAEIVRGFLKGMGVTEQQSEIGYQLHGSDALGELSKGDIHSQEAYGIMIDAAKATGITPQEFFGMLRPFYVADASSYPMVYRNFFSFSNQGWGGQGPLKMTTNNGKVDQLASQIQAWRPAPPPKPAVEPKPGQPETENFDPVASVGPSVEAVIQKAPEAPVPVAPETAIQAVKSQAPTKKPTQTVSTSIPPQVAEPTPQPATPQGTAAVKEAPKGAIPPAPLGQAGAQPETQPTQQAALPAAPAGMKGTQKASYSMKDFCCSKTFATDDGRKSFRIISESTGVITIGEAKGVRVRMDGPATLCLQAPGLNSCFEVISTEWLRSSSGTYYKYTGRSY